jgi:acyl-CoA thioesterase-1
MTAREGAVADELVFVALGDSLTVGYHSATGAGEWSQSTPYTTVLDRKTKKLLGQWGSVQLRVTFLNRGVVGELTSDMLNRFDSDAVRPQPHTVIILGGSNDLGWGSDPSAIASNLAVMFDEALAQGIRPVACTVPSILGFDEGIGPRIYLNRLIREQSAERSMLCVDLFTATAEPATQRLRAAYSDDGLHLTPLGYHAMADAIFNGAVEGAILERLERMQTPP